MANGLRAADAKVKGGSYAGALSCSDLFTDLRSHVTGYGPQTSNRVYDKVWTDSTRAVDDGDGAETTFYTAEPFVDGTLQVAAGGALVDPRAYTATATTGAIVFSVAPAAVEISAWYQRAVTPGQVL